MTDSEKLDLILKDLSNLISDMQEVKQKVIKLDMTLENEIRVNIQRVIPAMKLKC